jgi:hypothetical protein
MAALSGNIFQTDSVCCVSLMGPSRIRFVKLSPLEAASQSIADSLSFFYECARRKSSRNSRSANGK